MNNDIYFEKLTKLWEELSSDHKKLLAELAQKFCEYQPMTRVQYAQKIMTQLGKTPENGFCVVGTYDVLDSVEILFESGSSTKVSGRWAKELKALNT